MIPFDCFASFPLPFLVTHKIFILLFFRDIYEGILDDVTSEHAFLRKSASASLEKLLAKYPEILELSLDKLALLYADFRKVSNIFILYLTFVIIYIICSISRLRL